VFGHHDAGRRKGSARRSAHDQDAAGAERPALPRWEFGGAIESGSTMRCSIERTIFSGVMSLPLMRLMFHERRSFVSRAAPFFTPKIYRRAAEAQRKNVAQW
jgi:hypothetical protein